MDNQAQLDLDEQSSHQQQQLDDTQNITSFFKDEKVDFGVGSVVINPNDPDIDQLNTASLVVDRDQVVFNSHISRPVNTHQLTANPENQH